MGQKVAGTAFVKVDGAQLTLEGGLECPISDKKRETVVPGFFKEEDLPGFVKVSVVDTPDFPRKALVEGRNMTVTAEQANGKTYVLSQAYLVGEPSTKSDSGTIEVEFNGVGKWLD